MDLLYTAVATARGGREGEVVSEDGAIDLLLAHPKELGGPGGDTTNPEQLLAAGWAACFHSALKRLAGRDKVDVTGSSITAQVSLAVEGQAFGLAAALVGSFPTLDDAAGLELMRAAHEVCPFSRAMRGNVDPQLQVAPQ